MDIKYKETTTNTNYMTDTIADVVVQNTNITHSSRPLILHQPFSRTNHFYTTV